jgi:probable O-glycosylation ligase (exosortase A-associated)
MGIRYLIVVGTVFALCVMSPFRPILGLYGYYWFAMMRPDILSWAGPNRYSLLIAVVALFSNSIRILRNLPLLILNPILRNLVLFFLTVTISVIAAVDASLCWDRYLLFSRMFLMALIIPLVIETREELRWFFLVVAGSLGLLGSKFGLWGLLRGGVVVTQGYGAMLSDNNTMALAFAMAIPLCWFSRRLVPWKWARLGFLAAAICCAAAVIFTHSRGGILAVGIGLLAVLMCERRKMLAIGVLALGVALVSYLVWDTLTTRMSTLEDPMKDASARNRILMLKAAPKLWMDYPFFGVGFTEANQQRLLFKYIDPSQASCCIGLVLHNTWAQILVDSGIFAFLLYMWLLFSTIWRSWFQARCLEREGRGEEAALLYGVACSLVTFLVGASFLSRTGFDLFYVLLCTFGAWLNVGKRAAEVQVAVMPPPPPAPAPAPEEGTESAVPVAGSPEPAPRIRSGRGGLIRPPAPRLRQEI